MPTVQPTPADLIITDAHIHTVDPANPRAAAIAVTGGLITAVGSDDDVARLRGSDTRMRDAHGAFLMPGLVDVHNHHTHAGMADLYELTFSADAAYPEVLDAVRAYALRKDPNEWIVGSSWGTSLLDHLSREEALHGLDDAAGGRPVILTDDSHHNRWVNSRALELSGVTTATSDPQGGTIVRDARTGAPTGVMLEAAGLLIEASARAAHAPSAEQYEHSAQRGIEIAHSFGITAFQDAATSLEAMRALAALDARGALTSWVVSSMPVNDQIFGYEQIGDNLIAHGEEFRSVHHRPDFIKIFLDGTPPAHSGAFLEPYLATPDHGEHFFGHTTMPANDVLDWLRKAAKKGLSAKIHCSGDAAVRMVLDAVQTIRGEGYTDVRYQIAHGQFISEVDLPRMAELGVIADISPFLWFPGVIADALTAVLAPELIARIQPVRTLIEAGALVAGGSDWPVSATPNAWEGIHGLVTRSDPSGARPGRLAPDEAITAEQAIAVFTINGATAMGLADVTGSLTAGKSADFVILDRNPLEISSDTLAQTTVLETWFAGQQVFAHG